MKEGLIQRKEEQRERTREAVDEGYFEYGESGAPTGHPLELFNNQMIATGKKTNLCSR